MFAAKKNKYAKIAVPFTVSKGQALRVFVTISTPRFTSGRLIVQVSAEANLFDYAERSRYSPEWKF